MLQDEDSPPSKQTKGKMEAMEREIKREDGDAEIKQEPMDIKEESEMKQEGDIKLEPRSPDGTTLAPRLKIEPIAPSQTDKKPKCCKLLPFLCFSLVLCDLRYFGQNLR